MVNVKFLSLFFRIYVVIFGLMRRMEDLDAQRKMNQFLVLMEGHTTISVRCVLSYCKYPHPQAGQQVDLMRMALGCCPENHSTER